MKTYSAKNLLATCIIAALAGLTGAGNAFAAEDHDHGSAAAVLQLNAGSKWETDAPLQQGMLKIRAAVEAAKESGILVLARTGVPGAHPWMLGVANVRGTLLPVVDLKQFLEGERTVMHESQRVLVVRQPGGEVAVTIDELYGQRSFVDGQGIDLAQVSEGRYSHFIDRAYRMGEQDWGVFSLARLARTPEFRQAAA